AVVVVDNASGAAERAHLRDTWAGDERVRLVLLDDNRQFAGGLNAGAAVALGAGADRLFFLNNDTVLEADACRLLGTALGRWPGAGVAGPRILDLGNPARVLSTGERHDVALLCVPRTLLRHRPRTTAPFRAGGVMGCTLMVTRACFEAVGGFAPEIEVYY